MSAPSSGEPKEPLNVYTVLMVMIEQTSMIAWQKLGLQHDPISGRLERDLAQAKVAIDATAALGGLLEPQLDEGDKRQIQNMIRDLRVNFVEKSKESQS